ncbi:MAG: hypothetical protein Q8R00_03055 [Candidatus Nanoarchaeia archaeon]|nr:hypothetical protein [Candidatus Nanoarchaeia archaeon]
MEKLELDLYNFVGPELNELAWQINLPIHPNIGLWAFLEAFRTKGFVVEVSESSATFRLVKDLEGVVYSFQSKIDYETILKGWKRGPVASPPTFYDSIFLVYDTLGQGLDKKSKERSAWEKFRDVDVMETRQNMEEHWKPFFNKYHEAMMLHMSGEIPVLKEPKIIHEVLKDYPVSVLQKAILYEPSGGPCEDTLMEMEWDEFDEDYHPSETTMISYFWGHYLYELAKEKGYSFDMDVGADPLKFCVAMRNRVIKRGGK